MLLVFSAPDLRDSSDIVFNVNGYAFQGIEVTSDGTRLDIDISESRLKDIESSLFKLGNTKIDIKLIDRGVTVANLSFDQRVQ